MKSGRVFRRKKTNLAPALAGAVTLYAPGNYPVPYGANGVRVGGRGASGTAPTGGNYLDGGYEYTNPTYMWGSSYTVYTHSPTGLTSSAEGDDPWGPALKKPARRTYYANAPDFPGPSVVNYNIEGYDPGYTDYNPTYYNPYYPGTSGPTTNIGGVTFPGGTRNVVTAPTVTPTISTFKYQTTSISITVPSGGFVTLTPIS